MLFVSFEVESPFFYWAHFGEESEKFHLVLDAVGDVWVLDFDGDGCVVVEGGFVDLSEGCGGL